MSVRRCQQEVSSREFTEWMAFNRLEPFGPERDDLGSATVAATIAEVNRNPKARSRPYTPKDFMPTFGEGITQEVLTPEETLERAKMVFGKLAEVTGGKKEH